MTDGTLDEALQRLRNTGPERNGWLSNHAPMAVEVMSHHGHGDRVHRWIDGYFDRLEEPPRGIRPIGADEWRDPLGDPVRTGDWLAFFDLAVRDRPWREVLLQWWPRLLPGIAAGATHGVIRVGHAVRALLDDETPPRVAELAQGLAYWAARWQPLAAPGAGPYRTDDPRAALDRVPRVPDQRFGIRARLAQLADLPAWAKAAGAVPGATDRAPAARLADIAEAAVRRLPTHGYADPVMLVHAATAPTAVLRVLPVLPAELAPESLSAGWAATAAVTAAYSPTTTRPVTPTVDGPILPADDGLAFRAVSSSTTRAVGGPVLPAIDSSISPTVTVDPAEVMQRAVIMGDPHAIKFTDAALDAWRIHADQALLAAADITINLIASD